MKFGQNLHRYQIVEWTPFYIDYNVLKKLYKIATSLAIERGENADFAEFEIVLRHNLLKVESFYKARHAIIQRRVDVLHDHYAITESTALDHTNEIDNEDLTAALFDLRDAIKQLQWYELVNFTQIVGRLRKLGGGFTSPSRTNDLRIRDTHLATRKECLDNLGYVDDWLAKIHLEGRCGSTKTSLLWQKYCKDLPSPPLISAAIAIDQDGSSFLNEVLEEVRKTQEIDDSTQRRFLFALLHFSTLNGRRRSVEMLASSIKSLRGFGDHLHWLVIKIGRRKKLQGRKNQIQSTPGIIAQSGVATETIDQLIHVIDRLGFMLKGFLHKKDSFGRLPLHHAVHYGLSEVCQAMLKYMKGFEAAQPPCTSSSVLLPDSEGLTALDIAVLTGNAAITEILLKDHCHSIGAGADTQVPSNLLNTALKLESFTIVQLLLALAVDVNYKDQNDETALYLAVRSGRLEYVNMVLEVPKKHGKLDLNATEVVHGWTPLILACVKGSMPVMEILLRAGADPNVHDLFGWTAKDHAAFRGHLPMAKVLMALDVGSSKAISPCNGRQDPERRIKKASPSFDYPAYVGQDVPPNCSQVYVNLGPLDTYNAVTAVNLAPYVAPDAYTPQREADFQVEIFAIDRGQSSDVIQLPILEDLANKPWRFLTNDARSFKLAFNISHAKTVAHKGGQMIGSAIALLESLKQGLGSKRESLRRDFTIPILHKDTLNFIGTVTFSFVIITPFPHPRPTAGIQLEFRRDDKPTIIGHRGIGKNDPSRRQLQIGENTIESFQSAIDLGASYVEFGNACHELLIFFMLTSEDVQITKDSVPIIYHDYLMSETGIDAPLHSLSLEQFMHISESQSTSADLPSLAEKRYRERCGEKLGSGLKRRSLSLNVYEQSQAKSLVERMKLTFDFRVNEPKGFDSYKGNIRSECIQASFLTFEDLFVKLPESVSFAVEIKYPMLCEAQEWEMDTYAVEVNHIVDAILENVYRLAGNRRIFLSSFSPEICILLSNKQHVYPVLFLTESGQIPYADARANSLQEAVHFAKGWRLPGVISGSDALVMSPDLIRYVKDSGLLCMSWGGLNDVPGHAKTQAKAGLDAIIINSVNLISKTLSQG